jgi:hypothetical protein
VTIWDGMRDVAFQAKGQVWAALSLAIPVYGKFDLDISVSLIGKFSKFDCVYF